MKKYFLIILIIFISCGPSEDEIQQRIDEAVDIATSTTSPTSTTSSTSTTSTTSTTIKRVNWTPSTLDLICPKPSDLVYGSEFIAGYEIKFGDNPLKITVTYFSLADEIEEVYDHTPENYPTVNWEKGNTFNELIYDSKSLVRDYQNFYFSIEIKDTSGTLKKDCVVENNVDISSLPPIIELVCPKNINQGQTLKIDYKALSRVFDVSYVDFNVILDGADNLLTLSDSNNLPSKGFRTRSGNLTLDVPDVGYDFNIVAQAEIYDSRGESSKTSCGLKAFTSNSNSSSNQNESTDSTTTTIAPTTTTTTIAPTTTTTTIAPTTYPSTPSTSTWSTFNGSGDSVLDISSVGTDVMIAEVSHTGSSNFSIVLRDSGLGYQGLKVNTIGSYSGIIPINFENEVNSNLEISADGNWEIIIKPIASSTNFDGNSISGTGDTVLEAYELKSVDSLTITHSGSSNFSIVQYRCNGSYNGLLVNTIGSYSGSNITDSGTCFLEINADGSWSISK